MLLRSGIMRAVLRYLILAGVFFTALCPVIALLAAVPSAIPSAITQPDDSISPLGDSSLPGSGAATDAGQGVDKAIDGTGQKYYNRSHYGGQYAGSGYIVTPVAGATVVTGLSVTSGEDAPSRDPASFSLYGSADEGITFTPIVVGQVLPAFAARSQNQKISFSNFKSYTTYKLLFPTVAGGPDMQVNEADLLGVAAPGAKPAAPGEPPPGKLALWYTRPATSAMGEGLPIGNGRLGGMVFGGTSLDRFQFNEDSLWTGDGNPGGNYDTMGGYQAFGDIHIALPGHEITTHYRRQIDLETGVAQVRYQAGGVTYTREYFASHPGQVVVIRFTADRPGRYTGTLDLTDMHNAKITAIGRLLTSAGALPNGEQYEAQVRVIGEGGTVRVEADKIAFENCSSLTLLLACGTNYVMDLGRGWHGENPHLRISQQIEAASAKPYQVLKETHIHDYQSLFSRVSLDLGPSPADRLPLPTSQRKDKDTGGDDPELEALLFQYGRYLLLSCSRPGGLPANLQGLWNDSNDQAWHCDYHANINVQMNYWPAEPVNLSECHLPFFDLVRSQLPSWRQETAASPDYKLASGRPVRGWALRTSHNIYGGMGWNWDKTANAWYCRHLWEHFAFGGDKVYLKSVSYPILKETTEFWEDHLKALPDGQLVVPQGWSPEHGPVEDGVSYNQEIVWDLFNNYVQACDVLGVDAPYRAKVAAMRDKLVTLKIGRWGQLQEWMEDQDDPNDHHRHTSHLYAVYPGQQISLARTPALAAAAKKSLVARGDTGDVREWSFAWRTALYARLHDGEAAHRQLVNLLSTDASLPNLIGNHPPQQWDGNFGITAGVAEMLLQSHEGEIHLLPALPPAWRTGSVTGLRARGGFTVEERWKNGKLLQATIHSVMGAACHVRSGGRLVSLTFKPGATLHLDAGLKSIPGGVDAR